MTIYTSLLLSKQPPSDHQNAIYIAHLLLNQNT